MLKLQQICKAAILCFAALFCALLVAQDKRPVAVLEPFTTGPVTSLNKNVVASNMNSSLVNTGIYRVIDKVRSERVLKAQGIKRDHLSDPRRAKRLGVLLGVELICVADIIKEGGYLNAKLSIIDVESGEVTNAAQKLITRDDPDSIDKAIKEAMQELLGIKIDPPKQEPVKTQGDKPKESKENDKKPGKFSGWEEAIIKAFWERGYASYGNSFNKDNYKFEVDFSLATIDETAKPGTYVLTGYMEIKMKNVISGKQHSTQFKINPVMDTSVDLIRVRFAMNIKNDYHLFNNLYSVVR